MAFPDGASAVTTLLVVADVERSVAWYRDVLGAELHRTYGGDSAVLRIAGGWLLLVAPGPPTPDKPTVSFAPPSDPDRVSVQLVFRVEDCAASFRELAGRGADFLTDPVERPGEVRAFLRDPDGHLFEISEST